MIFDSGGNFVDFTEGKSDGGDTCHPDEIIKTSIYIPFIKKFGSWKISNILEINSSANDLSA